MNPQEVNQRRISNHFKKDCIYQLSLIDMPRGKINPLHRLKLFNWMMNEVSSQKLTRQIYALACYYFDLYVQKIEGLDIQNMQCLGIACIMIASKIDNRSFVRYSSEMFPFAKILAFEKQICQTLTFHLHPETYIQHLHEIIAEWDTFLTENLQLAEGYTNLHDSKSTIVRVNHIYEVMDCVNMVINSLNFSYSQLCFNLFFILNYSIHSNLPLHQLQEQEILNIFNNIYRLDKQYLHLFEMFIKREKINQREPFLQLQVARYLLPFLQLNYNQDLVHAGKLNGHSEVGRQTFNKTSSQLSKKIIKRQLANI